MYCMNWPSNTGPYCHDCKEEAINKFDTLLYGSRKVVK